MDRRRYSKNASTPHGTDYGVFRVHSSLSGLKERRKINLAQIKTTTSSTGYKASLPRVLDYHRVEEARSMSKYVIFEK